MHVWRIAEGFCESWVSSQEITLLKLSEHINLWELKLILHYDLCMNEIGEK